MSARKPIRSEITEFKPYVAGRTIDEIKAEYGLTNVVKLASNENPLGVSPLAQKALCENAAMVFRYPRAGNPDLNAAIAHKLGVDSERVVAGNGSDEIIDMLIRVVARPGIDNIVAFEPCFSMYTLQAKVAGVEFRQTPLNPDYSIPLDNLHRIIDDNTAIVFVTSPDNPSGQVIDTEELAAFSRKLPERTLLVVDEAYIHFTDDPEKASLLHRLDELDNVCLLRTFSKAYGLAGLRLGFGVLPKWLADYILRAQIVFSVNWMAVEAGIAALGDDVFLQETVRVTLEGRQYVHDELTRLGCEPLPSQANFIMFRPPVDALLVNEEMLKRGIIIRPLKSYGAPDRLRVSIGTMSENRIFIAALEEILNEHA